MKRRLIVATAVVVVLLLSAAVMTWWWMGQPIYTPGVASARTDLNPPQQSESIDQWQVTNKISLYHYSVGTGRNVLMVHGGPGLPTQMAYPGLAELNEQYRFHYYDQRGCGQSSNPINGHWSSNTYANIQHLEGALGIGAQISDIERIRRILGDDKIIIIGHSYGAFLATLYAVEFPERVSALVLVAPADLLVLPTEDKGLFEVIRERLQDKDKALFDKWLSGYLDLGSVFERSYDELLREDLDFMHFYQTATHSYSGKTPKPEGIGVWMIRAQYFSMGRGHDYREALQTVTTPVLVIQGSNDLQSKAVAQSYSDAFPNAELRIIEGADHFPHISRPDEFSIAVSMFLEEVKQ